MSTSFKVGSFVDTASRAAHPVYGPGPISPGYVRVKGAAEWAVAALMLVATAPLILLLALLIKCTSRGPVFYTQTRLGLRGAAFRIIKLRTMVVNAEARTGPVLARRDDCRVTAVGKMMRLTHLDEFPQLWNVLRGEMALIGPRPERPELVGRIAEEVPHFRYRLSVRPGVTGLAQLLLPADDPNDFAMECTRRKLAHDLTYIRNLRLSTDVRIAIGTPIHFVAMFLLGLKRAMVAPCAGTLGKSDTSAPTERKPGQASSPLFIAGENEDGYRMIKMS